MTKISALGHARERVQLIQLETRHLSLQICSRLAFQTKPRTVTMTTEGTINTIVSAIQCPCYTVVQW